MRVCEIGGMYLRVADAGWADPLDATHAQRAGGRWNAPDTHATLYLNAGERTARANVRAQFAGLPYGPEDLDPAEAPHLVHVAVPEGHACELRTTDGLAEVGLPSTYPDDDRGDRVPWGTCQPIGAQAHAHGLDGVACRSAAAGGVEELAWFPREDRPSAAALERLEFPDWYWTGSPRTSS